MTPHAKVIVLLVVSGFAGAAIAGLALTARSGNSVHASQVETVPVPFCSSASDISGSTFYSDMTKASARMHEDMEIVASGDTDRDFMRMMIPHHQGAIDMALLQLKYGQDERLRRLSQSIIVEQGQEIAYMRTLLDTPSAATPTTRPAADH